MPCRTAILLALSLIYTSLKGAEPPYWGTIFVNSELVTAKDPSCFQSMKADGMGLRTMYDRRIPGWSRQQAYLFQAAYDDGLNIEVQVNTEFGLSSREVALEYARIIGQLPTALRKDVDTVWIHRGKMPFGGGNRNLLIHTEQAAEYVSSGILEETLIHEASHTSLDEAHARSQGWMDAQQADGSYLSQYAQDYPLREDLAESFLLFLGAEHLADRMDPRDLQTVESTIPHRIAYFRSLDLDLYPLVASPKTIPLSEHYFDRAESRWMLTWPSQPRQAYRVEASVDLMNWNTIAPSIVASEASTQWQGTILDRDILFLRIRQ
ncbi:MAG: hypothetical protein ACPGL0_04860 [Limisphaerales bacterium]|jgi:hypothetical protein